MHNREPVNLHPNALKILSWAQGRKCKGDNSRRQGEALLRRASPYLLRVSPFQSLFPDPLTPCVRTPAPFIAIKRISKQKVTAQGVGIRKAGVWGRKPKGEGGGAEQRRSGRPTSPFGCHPQRGNCITPIYTVPYCNDTVFAFYIHIAYVIVC